MNTKERIANMFLPDMKPITLVTILILLIVIFTGCTSAKRSVLTEELSEPLSSTKSARVEIDPGDGNLTVDHLITSDEELASGALQYLENQALPTHILNTSTGQSTLTMKASGNQKWIRLPWEACNGATDWQIHLNPKVTADLTAHTDGGNIKLNLASMVITRLLADTGGGNIEVVLPDTTKDLSATVKTGAGDVNITIGASFTGSSTVNASSGAGNVVVRLPNDVAARIHLSSGAGKIQLGPRFNKVDDSTYQTSGYDNAANKVEITAQSGAGNVAVETN